MCTPQFNGVCICQDEEENKDKRKEKDKPKEESAEKKEKEKEKEKEGEKKAEAEPKKEEPTFEILQNPARVMRQQVRENLDVITNLSSMLYWSTLCQGL